MVTAGQMTMKQIKVMIVNMRMDRLIEHRRKENVEPKDRRASSKGADGSLIGQAAGGEGINTGEVFPVMPSRSERIYCKLKHVVGIDKVRAGELRGDQHQAESHILIKMPSRNCTLHVGSGRLHDAS